MIGGWAKRSLARKWLIYHVAGLTAVFVIVGIVQQRDLNRRTHDHLQRSADSVASVLLEFLAEHPELFTTRELQPVVTRLAGTVPNVARISVVDARGSIVADSALHHGGPLGPRVTSPDVLVRNGSERQHYAAGGEEFLRLTFPVEGPYDHARHSTAMGALILDVRMTFARAEVTRVLLEAMLTFSVLLAAFWAGKHFLVNRPFVRALSRVTAAAARLGDGDLSVRLSVRSADEVGTLAEAFNGMADAIQHSHAQLTSEVERRRIVEHELEEARDAALRSARLKAEFVANMSHEIRTPMNGIIGMTSLLLDSPLAPDQRDFTETIRNSGDALLTIINDILDFSKIEAGKLTFEAVDFDVRQAIDGILDLLAATAYAKGVEIGASIDAGVPRYVRGDPGRFRQVLTNLVGNAVKFTAHGEVTVQVATTERGPGWVQLRISVRDTGIGIADDAQRHLFEPFTQADGSTTRNFGGTGLGLAISKRLVERMDGAIGVESAIGEGATFWFTARFEEAAVSERAGPDAPPVFGPIRVLIVDDHPFIQRSLHEQLAAWGIASAVVSDASAVVATMLAAIDDETPFSIVLLDRHMVGNERLEVAQRIHGDTRLSGTRVVVMASLQHRDELAALTDVSVAARLAKPVKASLLLDCLMTLTESKTDNVAPVQQEIGEAAQAERAARRCGRVLVVEDNAVNLRLAVQLLRRLGYEADTASDGLEGLRAAASGSYDLVFMDCQMPVMDGYAATAAIRQAEAGARHTTIIAMTANAMAGDREECLAAGMDDYVAKPVRLGDLRQVLSRWTTERTSDATASGERPRSQHDAA